MPCPSFFGISREMDIWRRNFTHRPPVKATCFFVFYSFDARTLGKPSGKCPSDKPMSKVHVKDFGGGKPFRRLLYRRTIISSPPSPNFFLGVFPGAVHLSNDNAGVLRPAQQGGTIPAQGCLLRLLSGQGAKMSAPRSSFAREFLR